MLARKALLVDDSKSARFVLGKLLKNHDLEVDMVDSAEAALEFLASNQPDAIFMDHLMKGMDGLAATSRIKTDPSTAHIPVVMCTSNDGEEYLMEAKSRGALGTLIKPPSPDKLEEILNAVEEAIGANHSVEETPAIPPIDRPEAENVVSLPLGKETQTSSATEESAVTGGLELSEIEESVAVLIAQKLRKFEQNLEEQSKLQHQEIISLIEQRLEAATQERPSADLETDIASRLEEQRQIFERQVDSLKQELGNEVMKSATVSRQVQEIARETAIEISEETAKTASQNVSQRAAREVVSVELERKLDQVQAEFTRIQEKASGRASRLAVLAAVAGIAAAGAVYYLTL